MMRSLQLGASLYVPATRPDLAAIGNRIKYPALRSVIFCTEDAVSPRDVPLALDNLAATLPRLEPSPLLRFVRVRNPLILSTVSKMDGVRHLTGFVLPKVTRRNLGDYLGLLEADDGFELMITLETAEAFDAVEMSALREVLLEESVRPRVLSLRIGGNDLLHLLGLRRPANRSVYTTPLGPVIAQLVTTFRPHGFNLTGPVFEFISRGDRLAHEARRDLAHGLFGKTAIHPDQVPVIESEYRVRPRDLEAAERILAPGAAAVFRLNDTMCEVATHRAWAEIICERARVYGVRGEFAEEMSRRVGRR